MRIVPMTLALAFALGVSQANAQSLVGLWEFEGGGRTGADGSATIGTDLALTGTALNVVGSGGADTGGASLDVNDYYTVTNPIGPNGGGGALNTNQYTLVMDIKLPGGVQGFVALADFDDPQGTNDGDYFLDTDDDDSDPGNIIEQDRLGVSSEGYVTIPGRLGSDYHRLVLSVNSGVAQSSYLDGVLLADTDLVDPSHEAGVLDGRWSMQSIFTIMSDNGGGEEDVTWISNLALYDGAAGAFAAASLGGAGRDIPAQLVPEPSTLALIALFGLGLAARRKR